MVDVCWNLMGGGTTNFLFHILSVCWRYLWGSFLLVSPPHPHFLFLGGGQGGWIKVRTWSCFPSHHLGVTPECSQAITIFRDGCQQARERERGPRTEHAKGWCLDNSCLLFFVLFWSSFLSVVCFCFSEQFLSVAFCLINVVRLA